MRLYKLTNQDGTTYEGYEFGVIGKVHYKEPKENPELCSSDVFHAYENLNLAFLMNPAHADISNPRVWELEGDVVTSDQLKVGSFTQEVLKELEVPSWVGSSNNQQIRVKFACLCAREALNFLKTPDDLSPLKAIEAAEAWMENPTEENADAAHSAADAAARAADDAAASYAAYYAAAAYAAARAAYYAADDAAASYAAYYAAAAGAKFDLGKLADEAVSYGDPK